RRWPDDADGHGYGRLGPAAGTFQPSDPARRPHVGTGPRQWSGPGVLRYTPERVAGFSARSHQPAVLAAWSRTQNPYVGGGQESRQLEKAAGRSAGPRTR